MDKCKKALTKLSLTAHFASNTNQHRIIFSHSILNDYKVTFNQLIGSGISGYIYVCTSLSADSRHALKILPDNKESFRELSLHLKCQHSEHIVEIYRVYKNTGIHPGADKKRKYLYVVMELMEGNNLHFFMKNMKVVNEDIAKCMMRQIALSLKHIHAQGVIHKDIKPENILIQNKYTNKTDPLFLKICDFGLSITEKSRPTAVEYSLNYVAPEVICKAKYFNPKPTMGETAPYDHRCDIWALGVLLYYLLTGEEPFYSEINTNFITPLMYSSIMKANYSIPRRSSVVLSDEAINLIQCLLKPQPEERLSVDSLLAHPWFLLMHSP